MGGAAISTTSSSNGRGGRPAPQKLLHSDVESAQPKDRLMKKRFSDEQIISMLKEQEAGERTADVCKRHGISQATFYKYNAKCGGMEPSDEAPQYSHPSN